LSLNLRADLVSYKITNIPILPVSSRIVILPTLECFRNQLPLNMPTTTRLRINQRQVVHEVLQQSAPPSENAIPRLLPDIVLNVLDFCSLRTRALFQRTSKAAFHLPQAGSKSEPFRLDTGLSLSRRRSISHPSAL
jgi:hypothetical protein